MLRSAVLADLPVLLAIRDRSGPDALSDPRLVTEPDLRRWIAASAIVVSDEGGEVAGFAATEKGTLHLLVDATARGKGIGRDLLADACRAIEKGGHAAATLSLASRGTAERHYRAAGWIEAGRTATGGLVLKRTF